VLLLPAPPRLAAADAAAFELPALAVFNHDVIRCEQMASLAGRDLRLFDRSCQAMMSRIATGFADTDLVNQQVRLRRRDIKNSLSSIVCSENYTSR
jgi:hypothetical protein